MLTVQSEGDEIPIMSWLRNFLNTRSGFDQYTMFLLLLGWVLRMISAFGGLLPLIIPAYVVFLYAAFRFFSGNKEKRAIENARFLSMLHPLAQWVKFQHTVRSDKEHRYFKCPSCGQQLRVPRGRGKVQITCRTCGATFEEKS